jgi:hypothetical protein
MSVKNSELVKIARANKGNEVETIVQYIKKRGRLTNDNSKQEDELREKVRKFYKNLVTRVSKLSGHWERLDESWLNANFLLIAPEKPLVGRHRKSFENLSERSKRARVQEVRNVIPNDPVLCLRAAMSIASKNRELPIYRMIKLLITNQQNAASLYKKATSNDPHKKTPIECLALFHEINMSKREYKRIRNDNREMYVPYHVLVAEKSNCWPDNIKISGNKAQIPLKNLCEHTASRILHLHRTAFAEFLRSSGKTVLDVSFFSLF